MELQRQLKASTERKVIVIWAPPFGNKTPRKVDRSQCGNCEITYDRSLIDDERTGAVIYHFDSMKSGDALKTRNPNHLHIFWSMESPATLRNFHYTLNAEEQFGMNATMTYRLDSDFLANYQTNTALDKLMGNDISIYQEIMKTKSKLAISVISDCSVTAGARNRLALIIELKNAGLHIDTYGKCFSNKVDADVLFKSIPQYKFYFAYENSYHCKDYITEKLFAYALTYGAVPVVWGATKEDYETITPPGSFIFAEEFQSPTHLIAYLEFLNENEEEYLRYFRWRTMNPDTHLPPFGRKLGFCAVCRTLHGINTDYRFNPKYNQSSIPLFSNGTARRRVPSLQRFIYGEDNPECLTNS